MGRKLARPCRARRGFRTHARLLGHRPRRSAIRRSGGACALVAALRTAAPALEIQEIDCHINDEQFALSMAGRLIELMKARSTANEATAKGAVPTP